MLSDYGSESYEIAFANTTMTFLILELLLLVEVHFDLDSTQTVNFHCLD